MCIKQISRLITVEYCTLDDLDFEHGRELVQSAVAVRRNAQAPYSHYKVGAAVLSDGQTEFLSDGGEKVFVGCNVECADYSGTTHAEQAAIAAMVAAGHSKIKMIAIACAHEDISFDIGGMDDMPLDVTMDDMPPPCGGCLQKIWENCHNDKNVPILSVTPSGIVFRTTIGDILPIHFDLTGVYDT